MEQVQSSIKKTTFQIKKRTQSFGEVDGTTAGFSGVQTKANNWDQRKASWREKEKDAVGTMEECCQTKQG